MNVLENVARARVLTRDLRTDADASQGSAITINTPQGDNCQGRNWVMVCHPSNARACSNTLTNSPPSHALLNLLTHGHNIRTILFTK